MSFRKPEATLLMHYAIPSEALTELCSVGIAKMAIFGFHCARCQADFHIDRKPSFCPGCGARFIKERPW